MNKYERAYMKKAEAMAETSEATRLKVGCVIMKGTLPVTDGVNGTPPGHHTNVCEDSDGATSWYVVHAEMNALMKAARYGGVGTDGATLYSTHSPCPNCAKHIAAAGIKRVVYGAVYRDTTGLVALGALGVKVEEATQNGKQ
jgi:dCMP deaminase